MKKIIAALVVLGAFSIASAKPYKAWDFQDVETYIMLQQQSEIHERAKEGNTGNYDYGTKVTQFYIDGGMFVDTIEGMQTNTNIGNYTEINGDDNSVVQDSGAQSNENTIN